MPEPAQVDKYHDGKRDSKERRMVSSPPHTQKFLGTLDDDGCKTVSKHHNRNEYKLKAV